MLWIAEERGVLELSQLDGGVKLEIPDLPGIGAVALDGARHRLWVLAGGTLHAFDPDGTESVTVAAAATAGATALQAAGGVAPLLAVHPRDGSVVLAHGRGIAAWDAAGVPLWSAALAGEARGLTFDGGGTRLWVAVEQGALGIDLASGAIANGIAVGGQAAVIDLAATPQGDLWLLRADRVELLSPDATVRARREVARARRVVSDGTGGAWVATDAEVLHLDAAARVLARAKPFFGAGHVVDLRPQPEDGALWLANEVDVAKVMPDGAVARRWRFEPVVRLLGLAVDAGFGGVRAWRPGVPAATSSGSAATLVPVARPLPVGAVAGRAVAEAAPLAGQLGTGTPMTVSATASYQAAPAAAGDAIGDFVVAWQRQSASGGWDVYARLYKASASGPVGGTEFAVTATGTSGCRRAPAVATDAQGNFAVVWQSDESGSIQVYGRLFDSSGNPRTGPFQVNATAGGIQQNPAVAMTPDGRFLVAWETSGVNGEDPSSWGIEGRAFQASGTPVGNDLPINVTTAGAQVSPAVAYLPRPGRFQVLWQSEGQDGAPLSAGSSGIWGRSFDAAGGTPGSETQIDVPNGAAHGHPRVASDPSGNYTVVWESTTAQGSAIALRRFFTSGSA